MSAKFTIDGSAAGAVKAVDDLNKILEESKRSADGVATASKKMVTEAQRIRESIDPAEKYDRKMQDIAKHVQAGTLTLEQARAKAQQYGIALEKAGKEGDKAFGADALKNVGSIATSIVGISSALDVAIQAMREYREEQRKAADDAVRARAGVGQLAQLAASATDEKGNMTQEAREKSYNNLVAEADYYLSIGAAVDRDEAAKLTFDLNAADISRPDREFAAQMKKTGMLTNVGGMAEAYSAMRTALGEKEVGNFSQFVSKGLAAGAAAPGTVEQLPVALARAGSSAKALGVTDEALMAAGATLAKEAGSPAEGGTKLAALLSGIQKSGIDMQGMSLTQMVERLGSENTGFGGVFKDNQEAIAAYRTLAGNLDAVKGLERNITSAQDQGLAASAAELPNLDDSQQAANFRAEGAGELTYVNDKTLSRGENLRMAVFDKWKARKREKNTWADEWDIAMETIAMNVPFTPPELQLEMAANAPAGSPGAIQDPKLLAEVRDYLKAIAENTGTIKTQQRQRQVTGPQE